MSSSDDFNLDIMKAATRYNNAIYRWLSRGVPSNARILDFGAGIGEFCNRFARATVCAVEIEKDFHPHIRCNVVDSLNAALGKFDLIYSVNVLEHIEGDKDVIQRLATFLAPGGVIRIFVPARPELFTEMDRKLGHVRRYTRQGLISLCRLAGLDVHYCRYFDSLGYFSTLAYKLIDNSGDLNPGSLRFYDRAVFPVSRACDLMSGGMMIGKNLIIESCLANHPA